MNLDYDNDQNNFGYNRLVLQLATVSPTTQKVSNVSLYLYRRMKKAIDVSQ